MKVKYNKLTPAETLLKFILQKMDKKCKDKDFLQARSKSEKKRIVRI